MKIFSLGALVGAFAGLLGCASDKLSIVWQESAPLPRGIAGQVAGIVGGKLVAAGGNFWENEKKIWSADVWAYDEGKNLWGISKGLPSPIGYAVSASVGEEWFVFGGIHDTLASCDVIQVTKSKGSSEAIQIKKIAMMPEPRVYASSCAIANTAYIIGGNDGARKSNASYPTLAFEVEKKTWSHFPPLPNDVNLQSAAVVCDNKIFVFGGYVNGKNVSDTFVYDPGAHKATWKALRKIPVATRGMAAVSYRDRYVLLFGGYTDLGFSKRTLVYDTRSNKYSETADLPQALMGAKAVLQGDTLSLLGGEDQPKHRSAHFFRGKISLSW